MNTLWTSLKHTRWMLVPALVGGLVCGLILTPLPDDAFVQIAVSAVVIGLSLQVARLIRIHRKNADRQVGT